MLQCYNLHLNPVAPYPFSLHNPPLVINLLSSDQPPACLIYLQTYIIHLTSQITDQTPRKHRHSNVIPYSLTHIYSFLPYTLSLSPSFPYYILFVIHLQNGCHHIVLIHIPTSTLYHCPDISNLSASTKFISSTSSTYFYFRSEKTSQNYIFLIIPKFNFSTSFSCSHLHNSLIIRALFFLCCKNKAKKLK